MAETEPKLQPALLSLSAMISQYFTNPTPLVVILNRLRRRFAQFKLRAHSSQPRSQRFNLLLLFGNGRFLLCSSRFQFLHLMVFNESARLIRDRLSDTNYKTSRSRYSFLQKTTRVVYQGWA
jgi:hypothetical protein